VPEAAAVNVAVEPLAMPTLVGWVVNDGAIVTVTVRVAALLTIEPPLLLTNTE
jgi:hypothetical protein